MEFNFDLAFVTFDGRVMESFGPTVNVCGRVHCATLARAWLEDAGGKLWLRINTVWNTSPIMIPVAPDRRQFAEQLLAQVHESMRGYRAHSG